MSRLDLDKLKQYRDEILKAEIGALLFNLGKTHIGFWKEKENKDGNRIPYFNIDENSFKNIYGFKPFSGYRKYYQKDDELGKSPFEHELEKYGLKIFIFNEKVKFPFNTYVKENGNEQETNELEWLEFFKGDASNKEIGLIQKIFFRGCENINSGIDKGSPNEQLKSPLWLSNAFGSFKEKIDEQNFDQRRLCFYSNLSNFLGQNGYFQNPNWKEIRNFVLKEIKNWYSHLLSDSRFPVNDVSLYDQAYMTASMFKAVLSQLIMDSSKLDDYQTNPSSIKWRILGIQYDKFGLAEKGLKLASIQWYREISEKIDEEIKKLLEVEYPIGNEIYRDETGIYFIVGENLGEDLNDESNLAKLKPELEKIEEKVLEIFEEKSNDEFYPAIFLTKASRGLMNLSYLLENAKNNLLKRRKKKSLNLNIEDSEKGKAIGICPICQVRLIYESDKEKNNSPTICKVCDNRTHHKQVSKWIDNISGETIWIEEVKDKNNRVAYISLKFELEDWLNGNLLNSFINRKEKFPNFLNLTKNLLMDIKQNLEIEEIRKLFINESIYEQFISLYDEKGIVKPFLEIKKSLKTNKNINNITEDNGYRSLAENLLKQRKWIEHYSFFDSENETVIKNKKKNKIEKFSDYDKKNGAKEHLYKIFSINYVILQISNTILERSIGQKWEEFIKSHLSNPNAVNFESRTIKWNLLDNSDIEFLATLLLQFLLRKNPSPARLRRIWETTREFFEDIHKDLDNILKVPEWRKKRLVWEIDLNENNKLNKSMELEAEELLFWAEKINDSKAKIYLISSIKDFLLKFGKSDIKKQVVESNNDLLNEKMGNLKENIVEKELVLKPYNSTNDEENNIKITTSDFSEIKEYKPFAKITDPSPKNYQIVIPAEYLEKFIDEVMERYNKEFKYVYGKLPLHIGIVISHYKKPAYVNLKALRRIRRNIRSSEVFKLDRIKEEREGKKFREFYREKLIKFKEKKLDIYRLEIKNRTHLYYSLYWDNKDRDYNFFIAPSDEYKYWLSFYIKFKKKNDEEEEKPIIYYPNTFDFEFMDTNTRRNDIFYDEENSYKRAIPDKSNRPYEIEEYWDRFKEFKKIFKEKSTSSKLHNLVHILYDKLKNFDKRYAPLLASSFIKILELNKKENKEIKRSIAFIFDIKEENNQNFHEELKSKLEKEKNIKLFLDMFEFWHTMLKEV